MEYKGVELVQLNGEIFQWKAFMNMAINVVTAVIPVTVLPQHETTNVSRKTSFSEESTLKETSQHTCKFYIASLQ
jgi:hypothetical protein